MNTNYLCRSLLAGLLLVLAINSTNGQSRIGKVAEHVADLQREGKSFQPLNVFNLSPNPAGERVSQGVSRFTMLELNSTSLERLLSDRPDNLNVKVPDANGAGYMDLILYKVNISQNGFTLQTSDGKSYDELNPIVHYRGIISGDMNSVVAISFSREETMGMICNDNGNFIIGKIDENATDRYIFYNDKDLAVPFSYECGTNTLNLVQEYHQPQQNPGVLSQKCVDWYYEIDYDIYVGKGSLANVNSYIQGAFNQVSTLYNNDGISITLQTLYVWTSADPYTGPSTSNYLNQFGAYRTSFAGDLANLVGYAGGGGIAYVNGLCASNTAVRMGYMGISSSYNSVPTYSWTVEVITHEDGHLLGSRHTHDCVWNGNNTRIDNCGPQAGYSSGSCAAGPMPSSGTIMSYCHLVSGVGINFNNGFGPQPTTLMLNNVNNANCLAACSSCQPPSQPGTISGVTSYCGTTSQTYSVSAVSGATSYIWSLPSGWTGSSTTTSINATTSGTGGTISVIAVNSCGNSTARTLSVTGGTVPSQPGNLSGSTSVCQGSSQLYSVSPVSGATSYNWTLPSGWTGSSTSNSITVTPGSNSGTISVTAVNNCGNSIARTLSVASGALPAQPGAMNGTTSICANTSYTYSVASVPGATSYTWVLPSGWSGSSTTNSINVTTGSSGGTISVSATNGCGTSAVRTLVTNMASAPAIPGTITTSGGIAKVCPGDTRTYSISAVSGATSYIWTTPAGATITSGQGTVTVSVSYNSGFIAADSVKVRASNGCAVSDSRNILISLNSPGKPSVITGQTTSLCQVSNIPFSVTNVAGMNYSWSFNNTAATITSGQGSSSISASFTSSFTSSVLSVTAGNGCGVSDARTLTVNGKPAVPAPITGTITPCANQQNVPYSTTPVAGAVSYTWKAPSGSRINDGTVTSNNATLVTTATSVTINFKNTAGNVRVRANNNCGSSAYRNLAVTLGCRNMEAAIPDLQVNIYPNPASGIFHVKFESSNASEYTIRLIDLSGKEILMQQGIAAEGENDVEVDVNSLTPGIYMVEMMNDAGRKMNRIIISE